MNPQDIKYIRSAIVGQLQANLFGSTLADKLEDDEELSAEEDQEEDNHKDSKQVTHKKHDDKEKKKTRRDKDAMEE